MKIFLWFSSVLAPLVLLSAGCARPVASLEGTWHLVSDGDGNSKTVMVNTVVVGPDAKAQSSPAEQQVQETLEFTSGGRYSRAAVAAGQPIVGMGATGSYEVKGEYVTIHTDKGRTYTVHAIISGDKLLWGKETFAKGRPSTVGDR